MLRAISVNRITLTKHIIAVRVPALHNSKFRGTEFLYSRPPAFSGRRSYLGGTCRSKHSLADTNVDA
jgi:hypothetical protein